jgi:GTP-binding protein
MEKDKKNMPKIIIFGRTNVGKSTLFNTLTESNRALTSKIQCTTRDSNVGEVHWQGKSFELVDTGGIVDEDAEKILKAKRLPKKTVEEKVQSQALGYIKKADLILFLVDAKTGLLPQDSQMAHYLKKRDKKNILLIANKADTPKYRNDIA